MSASSVNTASDDDGNLISANAVNSGGTPSVSTDGADPYGALLQAFGMPNADKDANKSVLAAVVAQNKNLAQNSATVAAINQSNNQAGQQAVQATMQGGEDDKIVASAKMLSDMKSQQDTLDFATALGTNPNASSYLLNQKAGELRDAMVDAANKTQSLKENMSTSFWDNPGKWLTNVFTQGGQIRDADIANNHVKEVQAEISSMQSLTQEDARTNNAIAQTTTAATVAATLDHISQLTKIAASKQLTDLNTTNLMGIEKLTNMGELQLNNLRTAASVQSQQVADARAQQEMQLRMDEAKRQATIFDQGQQDRQQDINAITQYGTVMQRGAQALGIKDFAVTQDPRQVAKLANLMPKDMQQAIYQQGIALSNLPPGVSFISNNPADVAKTLAITNAPLGANDVGIKKLYQNAFQTASAGGMVPGTTNPINTKDIDSVSNAAGIMAKGMATKMNSDVMAGGLDNIYAPKSYETLFKTVPGLAQSEFYTKVLKPQMDAGQLKDFNPAQLISLAATATVDPKIKMDYNSAVNSVAAIFNAQTSMNNNILSYNTKGLPMQDGFKTNLPGAFFGTTRFDLTKADEVSKAFSNQLRFYSPEAAARREAYDQIQEAEKTKQLMTPPKSYADKFKEFYGVGDAQGGNQ